FRRFNRDIRDDLARVNAINRLDNEAETMEWLNSFLDKFWVIYMPAMSEMVLTIANGILKDLAPGFGIDKLSLDEFTLGSKAPRINSVRSYPKKAEDHIEMDWDFSFTPNDTDGMTKAEIKKKIDPKVALGVTIGKAFISKSFPVLVEDMSMTGRLKIRLKLSQNFPHVKIVSVQFLEAPTIEYGFKPMGGDTLGLDIMSFIPGLRTVVNGVIHSILRPMFYAPNSFDVDVEEMLAAQSNDSIGVIAVTVLRLQKLKKGNPTKPNSINPYVQLKISNNASINEKTTVKKLINDPVYNETKYLLVNQLDGNHLNFNVFHLVEDKADDQLIGSVDFQLADLLQEEAHNNVIKTLTESGKAVGKIEFNLKYFPVRAPLVLEDGTKEPILDAEVGILKLNLHEARDLDISSSVLGILNPYAEIYVNDELVKKCRRLRRTNEPSWGQSLESLITQQSETTVQVLIKDSVDDTIVAKLNSNLQDLVFETSRGQEWIETDPVTEGGPRPRVRITANWKAIKIDDTSIVKTHENAPIGGLRLHLRSAKSLKNLEAVGLVDPYVRVLLNGKLRAKTATFENTLDPLFNTAYFLPVANEHQHYLLQIMDEEPEGKDRSLGTAAVHIGDFLKRDQNGYFLPHDGADTILEQPVIFNGQPTGTIYYSVSFIPAIPVYSLSQIKNKEAYLEEVKEKEAAAIAKQAADEKLFKEKPNEYEWIEVEEEEVVEPKKVQMGLDSSIKYRSGIVSVHLLGGSFEKSDVYVHTLFDEQAYSSGVSPKSEGNRLSVPSSGDGFVRDLPLSKLIIRIAKKVEVDFESDIIAEQIFDTLDILKKSYSKPITLRIQDRNQVKLQLEFIPSDVQLNPLDTVLDIGKVKLEVIGADNLKSVDTNGKSDPLCVVKLDGKEILKTDKKRKTLSPVWNESVDFSLLSRSRQSIVLEVYDWDYTHDDELIGKTVVNLSSLEPSKTQEFSSELDTQGRINLRATFKPEYIRPKLAAKSALPMDLNFDAPMNVVVVGGAGAVAGGVVGGVGGIASEGIARGGSFLKGFGRSKKKHSSNGDETSTIADDSFASHDKNFSDIESEAAHDNASRHSPMSPSKKGREVVNKSAELQSLRSGAAPVSNSLQHSQVDGIARPPIPGHLRTPSAASDAASIASSFAPGAIPGRLTIVSASNLNTKDPVEVKVVLKQPTKQKDLFKTRNTKGDKSANTFKWNESVPFKSVTEGELIFDIREHHTFGKNVSLGQATVKLSDVIGRPDNLELNVGSGQLVVNVRYN
ncbi:putative xylanase/chitin deacetylase, partial [Scheffersomyces stipitis CBS 6054]